MGFSPDYIMKELSDDLIEELGGEDQSAVASRRNASDMVGKLEEAMEISRKALKKTKAIV